jgi:hypothetical protein
VDMAVSGVELRDAARLARESVVVGRAFTLARWIGTGRRPVTAGQVLRKADVPAAGAAVGVDVPPQLRTMADIRALHRHWCVAGHFLHPVERDNSPSIDKVLLYVR